MTFAEKLVQSLRAKSGFGKGFNRVADWSVRFAGIFILALQVCSAETIRYVYDSRSELIKALVAQFRPGFTHEDAKRLAEKALKDAQKKGRVKTAEVDGFIYDARELIGASNGKPTSHIQIRITPQGNLHIRPTER